MDIAYCLAQLTPFYIFPFDAQNYCICFVLSQFSSSSFHYSLQQQDQVEVGYSSSDRL